MNRAKRTLWFVVGAVVSGLLIFGFTSYGTPRQDVWAEINSLKNRVHNLEQYNVRREAAERKAAEEEAERQRRQEWIQNRRDP